MGSALKSIFRMKILAFLLIVILAFSLTLLNNVTTLNYYAENKEKVYREFFDLENTYLVRVKASDYGILDKVGDDLMSLSNKEVFSNVYLYGWGNYEKSELHEKVSAEEYQRLEIKLVSEGFVRKNNVKISNGRGLTLDDFAIDYKKQNIPMVLGDDFRDRYKIGDTFKASILNESEGKEEEITYEVIGFAKKNQIISFGGKQKLLESSSLENLVALTPTVKGIHSLSSAITLGDFGMFFEAMPNTSVDKVQNAINEVLNKYNSKYEYDLQLKSCINLKDDLSLPIFLAERDSMLMKILAFTLIFLSSIGLLSVILDQLQTRKKEFGIKIAHGAKYIDLSKELYLEILLICTLSSILSFIIGTYMNQSFNINYQVVIINIVYILLLSLLISVLPIIKLRSIATIELIRGK